MDPPATKQQLQRQFQAEERAHQLHLRRSHHCFLGRLHLLSGMKLLIFIGMLAIIGILVLESLYFRKAIFVLLIPTLVTTSTVVAILKQSHQLVWPIIGISFFHMFLAMYALLIFSYYFFFKPLYIIMVLNWAFDTLHTNKTPSYYFHCFCIYAALILFFLFNLWQSRVSIGFRCFLEDDHQRQSLLRQFNQTAPSSTVSSVSSNFPPTQPPPPPPQMGNKGSEGIFPPPKCSMNHQLCLFPPTTTEVSNTWLEQQIEQAGALLSQKAVDWLFELKHEEDQWFERLYLTSVF